MDVITYTDYKTDQNFCIYNTCANAFYRVLAYDIFLVAIRPSMSLLMWCKYICGKIQLSSKSRGKFLCNNVLCHVLS